jgi:hypothetical protein
MVSVEYGLLERHIECAIMTFVMTGHDQRHSMAARLDEEGGGRGFTVLLSKI